MTDGSLLRWTKEVGDEIESYDLLFELETESLTEEAYRVGDFAGRHDINLSEGSFAGPVLTPLTPCDQVR